MTVFAWRCFLLALLAAAFPFSVSTQGEGYWLITQVTGRWEYRDGGDKPRRLAGEFEPIFPTGEVRCLEANPQMCELRYASNARGSATERLPIKVVNSGQWISLKRLTLPPAPVVPAAASALRSKFLRVTRAGGSRAASGCGGDFPLKAPRCGENVAASGFKLRWSVGSPGNLTVLVERTDGAPALYRATAPASAGEFSDLGLDAFLRKVQGQSDPVDVTVRILGQDGKNAVRLIHVSPTARTDDYEARVTALASRRGTAITVTRMSLALEEGMWSVAAEHAIRLMQTASASRPLLEYAAVGLCQSDFEEEKASLKKRLPAQRFTELCSPDTTAPPAAPQPLPRTAAVDAPASGDPEGRLGVALLIGNSDYWNMPLNSVKSDVKEMGNALSAAGFEVTIRENLRSPRQFIDALDEVLKSKSATPDDVFLVYYSGHGLQLDGKAHLLSTGVSPSARVAEDLRDNAQNAEDLVAQMERAIPATRILIVEACRDNVLSSNEGAGQSERGGFAFQQDDVANTFVMFANKPGQTTPARSDTGLMGPFTEALIYALQNSNADILDVYNMAADKTRQISPGQEPVMYHSKTIDRVALRRASGVQQDNRARDLLNGSEPLYQAHAWEEFLARITRGRALASETNLQQRLSSEADFARFVMDAERAEEQLNWAAAGASWHKARELFIQREWVGMKEAVAWLLADELPGGIKALATLSAQSDSQLAVRAKQMLADLTKEFPALEAEARKAVSGAQKIQPGADFEKLPK